jgi:hypothetical protein
LLVGSSSSILTKEEGLTNDSQDIEYKTESAMITAVDLRDQQSSLTKSTKKYVYGFNSSSPNSWLGYFIGSVEYRKSRKIVWRREQASPHQLEKKESLLARVRLPRLISRGVWELCLSQAQAGWDFKFRVHGSLPRADPMWFYIRTGDLQAVRRAFHDRRASPMDVMEGTSKTLLHVCLVTLHLVILMLISRSMQHKVVKLRFFVC